MDEQLGTHGHLDAKLVRADGQELHHPVLGSLFERLLHSADTAMTAAGEVFHTHLEAHHFDKDGNLVAHHDLGSGLVTNAGVTLLAADYTNATATLKLANYHDSGTGTTAAAVTDTVLQTPTGNARVAGTQSNPANGQYRSVATLSYTAAAAITEWGLLTASTAGTLWDHKVFAAINVANGDSIQFTYTLTINAGG